MSKMCKIFKMLQNEQNEQNEPGHYFAHLNEQKNAPENLGEGGVFS